MQLTNRHAGLYQIVAYEFLKSRFSKNISDGGLEFFNWKLVEFRNRNNSPAYRIG
jgi:hypothetical protein